ncbi:hypothetical protein BD309DRAFT_946353 [Dichomitus squalens]|nr:hypothetical protein BD309DRAFT_946353 [Dichomitus squalens]
MYAIIAEDASSHDARSPRNYPLQPVMELTGVRPPLVILLWCWTECGSERWYSHRREGNLEGVQAQGDGHRWTRR